LPATDGYNISGGRNIVWIAGHLTLNSSSTTEPRYRYRALTFFDNGGEVARTIHVEGLLIEGNAIAEGINIDTPTATVQLQNIWMDAPNITSGDDRDGTGAYRSKSHPDVIQTYGGFAELRVDQFSARAGYQGIFLKVDHADGLPAGETHLSNVSLEAVDVPGRDGRSYTANRLLFWTPTLHDDVFVDNVWLAHSVNAGKVASTPNPRSGSGSAWWVMYRNVTTGVVHEEAVPGNAVFTDAVERYIAGKGLVAPTTGKDDTGTYLTYANDAIHSDLRNADDTAQGRIYSGLPSGEHFVSEIDVGTGYTSPGYGS
jgi:hypothetical protein